MRLSLLTAALFTAQAFAGTPTTVTPVQDPEKTFKHFSGSFTLAAETNYVGRGLVATHAAEQGDGTETIALKGGYAVGPDSPWSFEGTMAYKILSEGHTLYGSPKFPATVPGMDIPHPYAGRDIKQCNMENEFVLMSAARYTREQGNVTFGHRFVHGGILGVMAKHYRDQGASVVNEVFVQPEWTPAPWLAVGCTTSYSFQGITGWWFEPYVTLKARVLGDEDNTKLAARLTFAMSATSHYFSPEYNACSNGAQAYWIKLDTPWFVTDNFIVTPYVSFNWTGPGADKANKISEFKQHSQDPNCIPFRDFAVVGGISATVRF